jgi:hypothetical protein
MHSASYASRGITLGYLQKFAMKASQFYISTLKEAPADAEVVSHKLMMRAGMIKKLGAGIYSLMPMGLRVVRKVEAIVREEMNRAGAVELSMPAIQPAELWMQSLLAICRVWRMPPHMIQELGRATWGNLQSEMVSFEKFTIAPWLRRIEGAIERDILPDDGELYAEFLVEGLLRGDITTRYQAYEIAVRNMWMTPAEVRQKENLGPLPQAEAESPGEVEDTPGDIAEDIAEGESDADGQESEGSDDAVTADGG